MLVLTPLVVAFLTALFVWIWWVISPTSPEQRSEVVKVFAQIVGASVLALGGFFTWRNLRVAEATQRENEQANRKREGQTQEAQFTDRYTKAVEQLGSDRIEVRLGGIYALERLANDSLRDYWTIIEVLTAYVRQRTTAMVTSVEMLEGGVIRRYGTDRAGIDTQAIITVLGRRAHRFGEVETEGLDLSGADLRRIVFDRVNLDGANLSGCDLTWATFRDASSGNARFVLTNLAQASFQDGCHLEGALFMDATVTGVSFRSTHMEGIMFRGACNLYGSDLKTANLKGANFAGAINMDIRRINPRYIHSTSITWPEEIQEAINALSGRFHNCL